ncbi:MAG: cyclic nucleotide-binding domain-containing protein [Hyphomicrobium sp.]
MSDAAPIDFSKLDAMGAPRRRLDAGEKVFLETDAGDVMYVVRSGRVDIITYGAVLENVRAGGMFGEIALIDGGPRSAAAMAAEPTEVVAINRATFLALIRDEPEFALRVMGVLATRLRRMNDQF